MFIDIWEWSKTHDVASSCRGTIADCKTNAYIWDPDSVPKAPAKGHFTYHAAHYSRCRHTEQNELYVGQTGVLLDPDCEKQARFCTSVIRTIRTLASGSLDAPRLADDSVANTQITSVIAGPDAYDRAKTDLTLIYSNYYYRPSSENAT